MRALSSSRSCLSSRSYRRSSVFWSRSSLTTASLRIDLARLANLSVDSVSEKDARAGVMVAIIVVRQLPPSELSRMRVSLLSR